MSYNFKETMSKPERLAPGHRMCAGCGGTIAVRNVLRGLHEGDKAVIGNATGCLEVSTFTYPYTAWEDSYIHNAFENAGATLSGVEGAYRALKRKGKLDETYKFITFGGDGGTYDIGFRRDGAEYGYGICMLRQRGIYEHGNPAFFGDADVCGHDDDSCGKCQQR